MAEQNIGDRAQIQTNLETWLRDNLKDRSGLTIEELRFPEASGESSVTLILRVRHDSGEEGMVVRMVPRQSDVFESHDLLLQFQMMEVMHREGIPAPPLIGYEPDPSFVGSDFYVMGFVDGRIPPDNPPMAFGSWVTEDLDANDRRAMWNNGLDTLAAIHKIDLAKHDFSRLPRAESGEPTIANELRKFDSMYTPEIRESADPMILTAWDYVTKNPPRSEKALLCWGDSRVGNVIWRDLKPVAVIDWEMANIADPLSDLAWWVWIDKCNSEGLGAPALVGVPQPRELYERWAERTGLSIANIPYFELLTVVRYSIILELKFRSMQAANPDAGTIPNFTVPYLPPLIEAAKQSV